MVVVLTKMKSGEEAQIISWKKWYSIESMQGGSDKRPGSGGRTARRK